MMYDLDVGLAVKPGDIIKYCNRCFKVEEQELGRVCSRCYFNEHEGPDNACPTVDCDRIIFTRINERRFKIISCDYDDREEVHHKIGYTMVDAIKLAEQTLYNAKRAVISEVE
jgi:hypothetical protein